MADIVLAVKPLVKLVGPVTVPPVNVPPPPGRFKYVVALIVVADKPPCILVFPDTCNVSVGVTTPIPILPPVFALSVGVPAVILYSSWLSNNEENAKYFPRAVLYPGNDNLTKANAPGTVDGKRKRGIECMADVFEVVSEPSIKSGKTLPPTGSAHY